MGLSVSIDGNIFSLATSSGWAALCEWVDDELSSEGYVYGNVRQLALTGECDSSSGLVEELKLALKEYPPRAPVRSTVEHLIELIGVGALNEVVQVVD